MSTYSNAKSENMFELFSNKIRIEADRIILFILIRDYTILYL